MNKRFIPGVIVVEGSHDVGKVSLLYESCFVITNGYDIPKEERDFITHLNKDIRVIVLTDNDEAGEKIRTNLNNLRENMINIRIEAPKESKKKGIAECDVNDIKNALDKYSIEKDNYYKINLYDLKVIGHPNSKRIKEHLCNVFHLGKCSNQNFIKRVCLLGIKEEELREEINHAFSR